ncbi:MAG: hypothetical protein FWC77_02990, partial [Defluviitaleaceae bacterium]|nr:hypothetical protein [Defluviitaleaceae bacterium]
ISLDNMAYAIKSNKTFLYRLEHGQVECNNETLAAIKKFLEIENAPLLEHEVALYTSRLWACYRMLGNTMLLSEAKTMLGELSPILDLPFENDLYLLYLLIEVSTTLAEANFPAAAEKISKIEPLMDGASVEAFYMFHRSKGSLSMISGDYKGALKHYLQITDIVSDHVKPDTVLFSNIGMAYIGIGKPYNAIINLECARHKYGSANKSNANVDITLALAYTIVGEYYNAKKIFDTSLINARTANDSTMICINLSYMSFLSFNKGNYEECISLCDQVLAYCQEDSTQPGVVAIGQKNTIQCTAILNKCKGFFKMKEYAKCQEMIANGRLLANGDKKFTIGFNALECLVNIDDASSVKYLEEVAIPHYKAGDGLDKVMALELCKEMEVHYKKKRAKTKASAFTAIARAIYEDMFLGEIDIDFNSNLIP